MYMKPMTPASMEMMVKITQMAAIGLGIKTIATTSMTRVPTPRQIKVEDSTPRNYEDLIPFEEVR